MISGMAGVASVGSAVCRAHFSSVKRGIVCNGVLLWLGCSEGKGLCWHGAASESEVVYLLAMVTLSAEPNVAINSIYLFKLNSQ